MKTRKKKIINTLINLEVAGELLKFSVRVNGVLAGQVCMCDVVQPCLQRPYSVEHGPGVVDGCRQSGGVLPRSLNDGRPPRPHRPDVGLEVAGKQGVGVRP